MQSFEDEFKSVLEATGRSGPHPPFVMESSFERFVALFCGCARLLEARRGYEDHRLKAAQTHTSSCMHKGRMPVGFMAFSLNGTGLQRRNTRHCLD